MMPLSWYEAYGPPGQPAPRVFAPILIGGSHNGEHFVTPPDLRTHLQMPKRERPRYFVADDPLPESVEFRTDVYRRATFGAFWMAPLDFWVESSLSDDAARALAFEHYFVGDAA